jgi:hypothetical protein
VNESIVVNLVGDAERGRLAESRVVDELFAYGGVRSCIALAFAAAELGREVELRGWIPRSVYDEYEAATGAAPQVGMGARIPERGDVVVVPEGWRDPLEYAQLAFSPAAVWVFVLAAPGLFGWPFTDEPWSPPDPLTVDIERLARPRHFEGMRGLGFRLLTHADGIASAAAQASVECLNVGDGRPTEYPEPSRERDLDVVALMENRWAPLVEDVLRDLPPHVSVARLKAMPNSEVVHRLGRSRILVWPSRVEGHASIPIEARAMGCVPVALDSNAFAAGLDEKHGAVTVQSVAEMAPTIQGLLADGTRREELASRGRAWGRQHDSWQPFLSRVDGWLKGQTPADPARAARAAAGAAFREAIERLRSDRDSLTEELGVAKKELTEATVNQERLLAELEWLRGRKLVDWAHRVDRFVRRR